jgi:hypothetical protein
VRQRREEGEVRKKQTQIWIRGEDRGCKRGSRKLPRLTSCVRPSLSPFVFDDIALALRPPSPSVLPRPSSPSPFVALALRRLSPFVAFRPSSPFALRRLSPFVAFRHYQRTSPHGGRSPRQPGDSCPKPPRELSSLGGNGLGSQAGCLFSSACSISLRMRSTLHRANRGALRSISCWTCVLTTCTHEFTFPSLCMSWEGESLTPDDLLVSIYVISYIIQQPPLSSPLFPCRLHPKLPRRHRQRLIVELQPHVEGVCIRRKFYDALEVTTTIQ